MAISDMFSEMNDVDMFDDHSTGSPGSNRPSADPPPTLPPAPPLTDLTETQLREYAVQYGEYTTRLSEDISRHVAEKADLQRARVADKERIKELQEKVMQKSKSIERRTKENEELRGRLEKLQVNLRDAERHKAAMVTVNVGLESKIAELEAENASMAKQHAEVLEGNAFVMGENTRMLKDHTLWEKRFLEQAQQMESWKEESERLRSLVAVPSGPRGSDRPPPYSELDRQERRKDSGQHRSARENDNRSRASPRETGYRDFRDEEEEREARRRGWEPQRRRG